jgi:hypothetical protein
MPRPSTSAAAQAASIRRRLILQSLAKARAEAAAVSDGVAETVGLEEARGVRFDRPRGGPFKRLDGLGWLASRGRLTPKQVQAGGRYGRLMQLIEGGDMASCLALFEIRGTGGPLGPTDAKAWARTRLGEARAALGDHPGLIFAMDQICGLGKRPREVTRDQRASERLEDRLGLGLDLLVKAWGL